MTEADAADQTAEKYRADGYDVIVRPDPNTLPDSLRDRRPALVAVKNGRSVLVEVWSRDQVYDLPANMPAGWDFDTVLLPGAPTEPVIPGPDATPEFARQLLTEYDDRLPRGATQARLLLAWSAAEAAIRVAAQRHGIPSARVPQRQLLADLTAAGVLAEDHYDRLRGLMAARNRLAHGSPVDPPAPADIDFLADLARDLLAAEPVKAAG